MNNLDCRKVKMNGTFICKKTGKEVTYSKCNNCTLKKYKPTKPLVKKTPIKKKTDKLIKMERERYSLFTEDLTHCYMCGGKKEHLHELIFGSNRLNSIKYGLVIPICSKCHRESHKNAKLQYIWKAKAQIMFEKAYPDLDFIKIFGKNYIEKKKL